MVLNSWQGIRFCMTLERASATHVYLHMFDRVNPLTVTTVPCPNGCMRLLLHRISRMVLSSCFASCPFPGIIFEPTNRGSVAAKKRFRAPPIEGGRGRSPWELICRKYHKHDQQWIPLRWRQYTELCYGVYWRTAATFNFSSTVEGIALKLCSIESTCI